jgi:hypothetical protein
LNRSSRADVRNPVLKDERVLARWQRLQAEHPPAAEALEDFLRFCQETFSGNGDNAWSRAKYDRGAYWKVLGVYARHLRLAARTARDALKGLV